MHLDERGNIAQADDNGGDSAQRTGFLQSVLELRTRLEIDNTKFLASTPWTFDAQWPTLFTPSRRLIRNPRDSSTVPQWNDPTDTSRDQSTPMIIAFGLKGMREQVEWLQPKGFILKFYQNKDVASPSDMNTWRRAHGDEPTSFGDFWLMQAVAIRIRQAAKDLDDVGDDLNCFITLAFSALVKPTDASRAALKRYLMERPKSYGYTTLGIRDPVIGALAWYCRPESGGNPELADLCSELISALRWHLNCTINK